MIKIIPTTNKTVVKFEFPDFITRDSFEFQNIDQAKLSPLAQKLFYLPFVKTVYISGNFVAIERYNIVEWSEVQDQVAQQIEDFVVSGGKILEEEAVSKRAPISIYAESTPNPAVMKFVANKMLVKNAVEFKNIEQAAVSGLAQALYSFPFVKEIFIDENYVSVTKYNVVEWNEVVQEMRNFIREYIAQGKMIVDPDKYTPTPQQELIEEKNFDNLDSTSQNIINILEEYVKPAVQADGGNIVFDSFDVEQKKVKVLLQGACSGCPSSTFTLKNGIENMLKEMLNDADIKVEAINA